MNERLESAQERVTLCPVKVDGHRLSLSIDTTSSPLPPLMGHKYAHKQENIYSKFTSLKHSPFYFPLSLYPLLLICTQRAVKEREEC